MVLYIYLHLVEICLLSNCSHYGTCFTMFSPKVDPCPDGFVPGELWLLESCGQCSCELNGVQCATCDPIMLPVLQDCYYDYNESTTYPECCAPAQKEEKLSPNHEHYEIREETCEEIHEEDHCSENETITSNQLEA